MSRTTLSEIGDTVVLARGEQRIHPRRAEVIVDDLGSVQPVLAMIAAKDDTGGVPIAYRIQTLIGVWRDEIVESARAVRRDFVVFMEIVIQHLVLEAKRGMIGRVSHR